MNNHDLILVILMCLGIVWITVGFCMLWALCWWVQGIKTDIKWMLDDFRDPNEGEEWKK